MHTHRLLCLHVCSLPHTAICAISKLFGHLVPEHGQSLRSGAATRAGVQGKRCKSARSRRYTYSSDRRGGREEAVYGEIAA